ncbi:MAG TPA: hypothetical protein ENN19_16275 [Chloroflexi bacterium]|nr:hypothetical protein [Chloroflexota bacterium]
MTVGEIIRTQFPLSLAKRYEAVLLEGEPQLRVIRLIELYESSLRHLALVGLAAYRHLGLADEAVESAREGLVRPSLGHWMAPGQSDRTSQRSKRNRSKQNLIRRKGFL